jgi:hypothetical protein
MIDFVGQHYSITLTTKDQRGFYLFWWWIEVESLQALIYVQKGFFCRPLTLDGEHRA